MSNFEEFFEHLQRFVGKTLTRLSDRCRDGYEIPLNAVKNLYQKVHNGLRRQAIYYPHKIIQVEWFCNESIGTTVRSNLFYFITG